MSQKLNAGGYEQLSQVADLSFKSCSLEPKTAIFGPKKPWNTFKTARRGKRWVHSTCGLTSPCQRALCGPLTPPYVPETAQKDPHKPQILCGLVGNSHKPRTGHIFGYMAQNAIPRAPTPPATPHFCGFHPSKLPKRTPRPPYIALAGCGKLQAQAQTGGGAQMGQQGPVGAKR